MKFSKKLFDHIGYISYPNTSAVNLEKMYKLDIDYLDI